ncbi:hypothetical protein F2Q70_00004255 [Brassica cretica]|uniref:Uncharacterized protein n=1 Tax=Brassica cretica TaxID=69181 RepID=A0A8S9IY18_BRACR|nr:hypothetical protein F2Q70_00004255 [Brassica cretica]
MDSWSLEIDLVTRRLREDPGVVWRPGGRGGARRFSLDLEIALGAQRSFYRSWDHDWSPEAENPEVSSLDPEIADWNPEEPGGSSLYPEIFDWNPEAIGSPGGTVLRLLRQGYYMYLFGFRILPLESWPLSSSYVVFYFCRKSLTGLEGAGGPRCALGCTGVLGSFDSILRLAHTHSCFLSHTRFDFVGVPLWSCHFLQALARIGGLWRPDPARMPL